MSIALGEFWTRLVKSGIADAEGCRRLAAAFAKANSNTPPSDAQAVARFMVKRGKLTRFQARALLATPPRELRAGNYLICSDQTAPPLSRWLEATRVGDGCQGVLLHAEVPSANQGIRDFLSLHQSIACTSLQPLELEFHPHSVVLFSALPSGRCLIERISDGQALASVEVCRMGIAIANALEALHAASLIHGQVRSDRVWISDAEEAILLRDPSASAPALATARDGWLDSLESPVLYSAPELQGDGQVAGVAADLYSLGCLLFRLATGRLPFRGDTEAQTYAAHCSDIPPELSEAISRGESGDPLLRVIAFAMAKNPAARFASAAQLASALQATLTMATPERAVVAEPSVPPALPTRPPNETSVVPPKKKSQRPTESKQKAIGKTSSGLKAETPDQQTRNQVTKLRAESPAAQPLPTNTESAATPAIPSPEIDIVPPALTITSSSPEPPAETDRIPARDQPSRRRRKKKSKTPLVLGSLCVAVLMLVIGVLATGRSEPEPQKRTRPALPSVIPPVTNRPATSPPPNAPNSSSPSGLGYELVSDERLLFAPPYPADSASPPLVLLPPGPAMIVTARLGLIARNPIAADVISSELRHLMKLAADRAGTTPAEIRRLSVALHPGKAGWPEVSLMVELEEAIAADELIARLGVGTARTADGATIYVGEQDDSDAFYWKESDNELVSQFAIGSVPRISEVAAVEGGAIPLPRSSQSLWDGCSSESELVILVTPNFLFADGRELVGASAPELARPLRRLMQPDVAAAVMSVNLHDPDRVFIEAIFAPSGGISEAALMHKVEDAVNSWPEWADRFILDSVPDPSWRLLASRLPSMMRFVVGQARFGISEGMVVANAYLPSRAFPQVTLATVLAMNTPSVAIATPTTIEGEEPLTVEQMLDRPMSVSFDQESLEFALEAIVQAFKESLPAGSTMPPARIIGGDLQLMGITQNQQVRDFAKTNLPLRTVLTDLVLGANSDKSAVGPSDPKQTLIWVVADDRSRPGQKEILITTRQAALSKQYELPSEFDLDAPAVQ